MQAKSRISFTRFLTACSETIISFVNLFYICSITFKKNKLNQRLKGFLHTDIFQNILI